MPLESVGMVETVGLPAALEASDAGAKAAQVEVQEIEVPVNGTCCVKFRGSVSDVQVAVKAAAAAAKKVGKVVGMHVIPAPHDGMDICLDTEPRKMAYGSFDVLKPKQAGKSSKSK
jgi:bacterial microcompartment shell protein